MEIKKHSIVIFALCFLISFKPSCLAQVHKDTLNVLFVGNSYIYFGNLPHIVSIMSESTNTKLITKKSVLGGAKLSEHWRGARGLKTKEIIENGKFDIVILQEYSLGAVNEPDSLKKYVKLFCDFIRKNNAKPYLFLTWAREKSPEQQKIISKVYRAAAAENNAEVVPVGEAWTLARKSGSAFNLFRTDGSHPSDYGTILSACVFVTSILHQVPVLIPDVYYLLDSEKEFIFLMNAEPQFITLCLEIAKNVSK